MKIIAGNALRIFFFFNFIKFRSFLAVGRRPRPSWPVRKSGPGRFQSDSRIGDNCSSCRSCLGPIDFYFPCWPGFLYFLLWIVFGSGWLLLFAADRINFYTFFSVGQVLGPADFYFCCWWDYLILCCCGSRSGPVNFYILLLIGLAYPFFLWVAFFSCWFLLAAGQVNLYTFFCGSGWILFFCCGSGWLLLFRCD